MIHEELADVGPVDVVAVGAHPDDVEVACGGTLAGLVRDGYRVAIVDLTDGFPTPNCPDRDTRMAECQAAGDALGVQVRVQVGLPNRRLMDGFEPRLALARWLRRLRPAVVIGFGERTPMHSPDHWQAVQITDAAIFYSRLSRWEEHFVDPPHTVSRHLYHRNALEPELMEGSRHHIAVDITETIDAKLASIAAYWTQFDHKPNFIERVRAAAVTGGTLSGVPFAETFVPARPTATRHLMRTLGLDGGSG